MSEYQMVRYHDGERYCVALAWTGGRKFMHIVTQTDLGVVKRTVPIEDERYCEPLMRSGLPYTVERGVEYLKRIGRKAGITQGAIDILDAAIGSKEKADV
jgi:hypothetical protein